MPATSDKDDKQGLVVLPSYGWLALFPYSRSSLFSRYTHFHCFAFFLSVLQMFLFWCQVSFGGGDSLLFGSATYLAPFHRGQIGSWRVKNSSLWIQVQLATTTGLQGRSTLQAARLQVFKKMLIFRCFLLGLCAGFPPLSFNFELPWKRTFPEIDLFDGWFFCGKM